MATNLSTFTSNQIKLYNHEISTINALNKTLKYQNNIRSNHTIPRKYKPSHQLTIAQPNDGTLHETFNNEFKSIFFKHLNEAIKTNTIALEIKKARLSNIIKTTESTIIKSNEKPEIIKQEYHRFITEIKIQNHTPPPELQNKIPPTAIPNQATSVPTETASATNTRVHQSTTQQPMSSVPLITSKPTSSPISQSTNSTTDKTQQADVNKKRKHPEQHPKATKRHQPSLHHFLDKSRLSNPNTT